MGSSQGNKRLSEALIEMGLDMGLNEYVRLMFKEETWAKEFIEDYERRNKIPRLES